MTNNKVKNIVNSKSLQNNTTTTPVNNNGIVYNGLARVTYMNGKKKVKSMIVKNNGTDLLFKYLTQCVCGSNVSANMPKYLDIGIWSEANKIYTPCTTIRCDLTSKYLTNIYLDNSEIPFAACFTSIIPGSVVITGDNNDKADAIRLYNDYYNSADQSLLAEIIIEDEPSKIDISTTIKKYSLMIEWYMYFTNRQSQTSAT